MRPQYQAKKTNGKRRSLAFLSFEASHSELLAVFWAKAAPIPDRPLKEDGVLRNDRDGRSQSVESDLTDVDAVYLNPARFDLNQPQEAREQGAFTYRTKIALNIVVTLRTDKSIRQASGWRASTPQREEYIRLGSRGENGSGNCQGIMQGRICLPRYWASVPLSLRG